MYQMDPTCSECPNERTPATDALDRWLNHLLALKELMDAGVSVTLSELSEAEAAGLRMLAREPLLKTGSGIRD